MDIRILRYFLAVAREKNITRAAESLHISQPSLSKQLMDLEQELGKPLLIRGKRKITLTQDGILLRKRAEEIVSLMEKTEHEISAGSANISGEISIGGAPTLKILQAAARFRKKYTDIRFHFYSSDANDVLERLDHGSLDFAVLLEPVDTQKYAFLSLQDSSRWGVLMPNHCPLARKTVVEKEDLSGIPFIMHRRIGLQHEIARWAQMTPEEMNIAATYNVANGDSVLFVKSGLGYFLTSENHITAELDTAVCFRPLYPPLELHFALAWKRYASFSKASEAFLQSIKGEINNLNH